MNMFTRRDKGCARKNKEKPLHEKPPEPEGTVEIELSQEPGPHVLVVEDDWMIRKATRGFFELSGMPASACSTLDQARVIMRDGQPRMTILDGELPDGSGIDFCRELRDSGYEPPILIYTALSSMADFQAGYAAGCTDYIIKPFDLNLLLLKSQRYLEAYEQGYRIDRKEEKTI
ncbi:MAG: response regulator [Clostridiales bacterium]|jgi:DNA-binding response OmpR family regulator|nr:response regulator [Clostridiales bacterium]